jgi:phenylpropionate dioxygenase-like ring-hydroxylating dioxygenase large terminal subunit
MAVSTSHQLRGLVDLEQGVVSREIFVNEEIYRQEQDQIFTRAWLFVGHVSQIPNPGDYFVSRMGEESVILTRDRQGRVHVFLNSCRHRGMKVCRYDEGNTLHFMCPFHGWSYDTDGTLVGVPEFAQAYGGRLDRSKWGLIEVAQVADFRGSLWATWDPEAPPFRDYLGDYQHYLAPLFDAYDGEEGGAEVLGGVHKWRMPCNWKFPGMSFGADAGHGATTHISTETAGYGPQGQAGDRHGVRVSRSQRLEVTVPELGHGCHVNLHPADAPYLPTWGDLKEADDYFREAHERRQRLGAARLEGGSAGLFPNVAFASGMRSTICVWHPHGPHMTEAWRFYLVDRRAPQEVKDAIRRYHMRYGGPVGMTEQDDAENWNYASAASNGPIARRHPYNLQMGMDAEPLDLPIPGRATPVLTEYGQRARFARWLEFMEAESWKEIYPVRGRGGAHGR